MEYDIAVIGGGIAGTNLTYELLEKNKKVILFDNEEPKATTVAGGLINPIMGRKMNIAWREPEIFDFAFNYYKKIETNLNFKFLEEKNIFRPFTQEMQEDFIREKIKNSKEIRNFILEIKNGNVYPFSNDLNGGILIKGGRIDTPKYIETLKNYFLTKNSYIKKEVKINEIKIHENFFEIDDLRFKKLVFSRGYLEKFNGFFSYLPFEPAKGEILIIKIKDLNLKEIYSRHVSLIPIGDDKYYLGGTYEWENLDLSKNEAAKGELIKKLKKITKSEFNILAHKAHVRPSTLDREPFLGEHPEYKNIFILNGLGTRGMSMAPYLVRELINLIEMKKDIKSHYSIKRYEKFYKNSDK